MEPAKRRSMMKALAYLLGARALDLARDRDSRHRPITDVSPGPIASTPETAAAWRRWAQAGDALSAMAATRAASRESPAPARSTRSPA
jgi:hypothetical protein